jgi:hypothetical protein
MASLSAAGHCALQSEHLNVNIEYTLRFTFLMNTLQLATVFAV